MGIEKNIDLETVKGFGDEWSRFDQAVLSCWELQDLFNRFFRAFPLDSLPRDAVGFDLGCGSGRWVKCLTPKVGCVHCIDASEAALASWAVQKAGTCRGAVAALQRMRPSRSVWLVNCELRRVVRHIPGAGKLLSRCSDRSKKSVDFVGFSFAALTM